MKLQAEHLLNRVLRWFMPATGPGFGFSGRPPRSAPGSLAELAHGEQAEVIGLAPDCQGLSRRRLLDLGLTPGARVRAEMSNIFGDPRAYRVRGTLVALRRELAEQVHVRPVSGQRVAPAPDAAQHDGSEPHPDARRRAT
jgi:Fe2+ transport system protein FeoA